MRDNSWIVGQPYLNLTGLREGCRLSGRKHISGLPTIRPSGFRNRRVTGKTRSGRQTPHNVTSGQSSGRRPRSAVAQDYLRNGDVTTLKRHIAPGAWSDHAPCADSRSIGCQGSITPSRFPQLRSLPDLLTGQEHHHPDALSGGSQRVALRPVQHQAGDALRGRVLRKSADLLVRLRPQGLTRLQPPSKEG